MIKSLNTISKLLNLDIDILKKSLIDKNLKNESFIEIDMRDFFTDKLYFLPSENLYIYFFENSSNRNRSTFILEFFKSMLNINKKYSKINIKFFLLQNNEVLEIKDIFNRLPYSLDRYSPDFEYILKDFEYSTDENLKKEIKLKMFSQMIKFISNDPELIQITKLLLNN
ncbi:putative YhgA-like transposase [Hypnocyclicus thermotrophus]|uniref:YhgA-like transposase n=1 Tax=Hypnocyclicus thermotrophus TaxID=1627895 RepID=A0AA46DYY0_9FUSO|nr:Rpn family recombination-promoting nuclease/putative transposase [Hypnocyclicus thermotrophus]TDT71364.1 putative YhgA-like transposase [Hypnocyclicus thermotrophus]